MNAYAWEIKMKQKQKHQSSKVSNSFTRQLVRPKIFKKECNSENKIFKNQKKIINDYHI